MKENQLTVKNVNLAPLMKIVQERIVSVRGENVILDADVADLYGVETRRINEAIKNNPDKFPADYMFILTSEEVSILRSKISTANLSSKSRYLPHAFTEKGLYMLATILKSKAAINTTFAIIETFSAVRGLKRELLDLHKETDSVKQQSKMEHFGNVLSEIVMPDLETTETESSLELNFIIGKIKHTVKRIKRNDN
ncbi:ORF6N domain-containing protein [Treponema sp.]|uniref:ORF6N domain-containing protein n=1 Tax=Treponema sp. TaxID=166 RepID=UPI0025F3527C|nr:ORF6N domain-containing protein [Treponema sp.]